LKNTVLALRQVSRANRGGQFGEATVALAAWRQTVSAAVPALKAAEPWSLFNRQFHDQHFAALRQLNQAAIDPALARTRRLDLD
jgi:hypothetical protein